MPTHRLMRLPRPLLALLPALALLSDRATAHERDFAFSRDWHLPYAGEHEIEARTFWQLKPNDLVQQFEYEYGITDHVAIEPGLTFNKRNADSFELEAADFELRLNAFEFAYDKLLPALNLEYERRIEDDRKADLLGEPKSEAEVKGILSWYTEAGEDFTLNVNFGRGFGGKGDHDWESEATFGYVRPLDFLPGFTPDPEHPFKAGIEAVHGLIDEHDWGAGPVVSWRASQHLHLVATMMFGLNDRGENGDELRFILEWEF